MYDTNLNNMPYNQDVIIAYTFNKANNRIFYTIMRKFQNSYLFQDENEPDAKSEFRILAFSLIPKFNIQEV